MNLIAIGLPAEAVSPLEDDSHQSTVALRLSDKRFGPASVSAAAFPSGTGFMLFLHSTLRSQWHKKLCVLADHSERDRYISHGNLGYEYAILKIVRPRSRSQRLSHVPEEVTNRRRGSAAEEMDNDGDSTDEHLKVCMSWRDYCGGGVDVGPRMDELLQPVPCAGAGSDRQLPCPLFVLFLGSPSPSSFSQIAIDRARHDWNEAGMEDLVVHSLHYFAYHGCRSHGPPSPKTPRPLRR